MMAASKISIHDYIQREFGECSAPPTPQTVRNHIRAGIVPGVKIGRKYYVLTEKSTERPDIADILRKIS